MKLWRMLRSALAGGAATLADMGVLAILVGLAGVSPRVANVPALLVGALVQFFGNRHFAFQAEGGSLSRQATLFALAEIVTLLLNGVAYDQAARAIPLGTATGTVGALAVRGAISFAVFVLWSYPVWRRIFGTTVRDAA